MEPPFPFEEDFGAEDGRCEVGPDDDDGAAGADEAGGAGVVTGADDVGGATGAHDSDSDKIGSFTGNDNDDNGVPGGTSTVNGI